MKKQMKYMINRVIIPSQLIQFCWLVLHLQGILLLCLLHYPRFLLIHHIGWRMLRMIFSYLLVLQIISFLNNLFQHGLCIGHLFSQLPTFQSDNSSLPLSSCILLSNCKLTLCYAGVLNSWTNSLQLGEYDENQKDVINRRNGQGPKHLKFFLLVFAKDEAQAQSPSPSPRSPSPNHEGQGQALNKRASFEWLL